MRYSIADATPDFKPFFQFLRIATAVDFELYGLCVTEGKSAEVSGRKGHELLGYFDRDLKKMSFFKLIIEARFCRKKRKSEGNARDIPKFDPHSSTSDSIKGSTPVTWFIAIDTILFTSSEVAMQDRRKIEMLFAHYPDLVTTPQLQEMLGGVHERTALGLLWRGEIKSFRVSNRYQIPKESVIDYLLSESYEMLKKRIEVSQRDNGSQEVIENNRKKLIMYCEVPRTRKDLMFLLDMSSKKTFFRLYLRPLLESGDLRMTNPEQPSVSTQKYVRVLRY